MRQFAVQEPIFVEDPNLAHVARIETYGHIFADVSC